MAPLWGGDTLSRGSRGVIPPAVSLGDPPQMAPVRVFLVGLIELHSTNRTSRESWENTTSQSARIFLHDYFLHDYLFFFQNPSEYPDLLPPGAPEVPQGGKAPLVP